MKIQNTTQLSQSQNLSMTPRLQQAIKFLQMNNLELSAYLRAEISANPLLEFEQKESTDDSDTSSDLDDFNDDIWDYYNDDERPEFDQNIKSERSLADYLHEQLYASSLNSYERKIGEYLIYQLSGNGYLEGDEDTLAKNMKVDLEQLKTVLTHLKTFDPVGVFASSVTENLIIQLQDSDEYTEDMQKLMPFLECLTEIDFFTFCKKIKLSPDDCTNCLKVLKKLNPYPSHGFARPYETASAMPEAAIKFSNRGELIVDLNEENLPKVIVNNSYLNDLRSSAQKKEEKTFITEQRNHANWIVNALLQRSKNMLAVCMAIAEKQKLFFKQGMSALKPLTLKDLAKETELHESTISRLTTGRFIQTPMGTFDIKFFFSQSLKPEKNLIDISSRYVQQRIQKLVSKEDQKSPLSDDELVRKLEGEGINIARRTISKYRKILKIMPSHQRRHAYVRKSMLGAD